MTKSWEPKFRFDPNVDFQQAYLDDLMARVLSPDISVGVSYHIERAPKSGPSSWCAAETFESTCSKKARYVVVSTVVNGMKESSRQNHTGACSIRHMSRRVRDYFGLQHAKEYEFALDERKRIQDAENRRASSI